MWAQSIAPIQQQRSIRDDDKRPDRVLQHLRSHSPNGAGRSRGRGERARQHRAAAPDRGARRGAQSNYQPRTPMCEHSRHRPTFLWSDIHEAFFNRIDPLQTSRSWVIATSPCPNPPRLRAYCTELPKMRITSRLRCSLRPKLGDGGGPQANGARRARISNLSSR
jgi:hypothetical protein